MRNFLIALSGIITIVAAVPYLIEIVRGKTKPRIVSWFTWTLLTGIACAASFADHQYATGILMLCATIEVALVVVLGFKHGDRKFERFDIVCQIAAFVGLALWLIFNSPAIAVLAAVTIDLIGSLPTFKHSWQKPHEETWITYALCGVGGGITVFIAGSWAATAIAYPLYILLVNLVMAAVILASPHRKLAGAPAELRKL